MKVIGPYDAELGVPICPLPLYRVGARLKQVRCWIVRGDNPIVCPQCKKDPFDTAVIHAIFRTVGDRDREHYDCLREVEELEHCDVVLRCSLCGRTVETNMKFMVSMWQVCKRGRIPDIEGVGK